MSAPDLLVVRDLTVTYPGASAPALAGCDLTLAAGETLAVVGASGCGKTTLARALLGLLPAGAARSGRVWVQGAEMTGEAAWRLVRGRQIGLVLQDPETALHPVLRIGDQVAAPLRHHAGLARAEAWARAVALLAEVGLPDPEALARRHPHELSGGMRQRVGIAAALAASPSLLVADEPTSSLDLTSQREILLLLRDLQRSRQLALVFVTHDLDLVPVVAAKLMVLDGGRVVEAGPAAQVFAAPAHAATRALLGTAPVAARLPGAVPGSAKPVLAARDLTVRRTAGGRTRDVVRGLDLELGAGEMVGLAGESGCGKSTLARALAGHLPYTGTLASPPRGRCRAVQLVFQDPAAALDPRQTILAAVTQAAAAAGQAGDAARRTARALLAEVGLTDADADRLPHELSGGQQRRVVLARALAADPRVLIADEPTSSVDPPTRARLLALLAELQARRGLAILLISHDLPLLRRSCQRVAVMTDGVIVEIFPTTAGVEPRHPFARELAAAAPSALTPDERRSAPASGRASDAGGCPWQQRCEWRQTACQHTIAPLVEVAPGHLLRCPIVDSNGPRSRD